MTRNVVLVVLDTTRGRDVVPADPSFTPTLASLAREGTEYRNAFAPAPWTLPSHGSLFTGTYPSTHGAHGESPILDDELATLPELFGEAGYETMAVSNNAWISGEFGFDRGFDTFLDYAEFEAWSDGMVSLTDRLPAASRVRRRLRASALADLWRRATGRRDDGADRTVAEVRRWLDDRSDDDPFFLFVNCIEPHIEYRPPRDYVADRLPDGWSYREAMGIPQDPRAFDADQFSLTDEEWTVLHRLYRAEIAYLDEQIGGIRSALQAAGEWEDTVFVVAGDHGENIGDHGLLGHQYCLYDTVLHVPLVLRGGAFGQEGTADDGSAASAAGDGPPASTPVDDLVQLTDLPPTLLDAAGIDAPDARESFQGQSFYPTADATPRTNAFAEYYAPPIRAERLEERFGGVPDRLYTYQRSLRAVRTDRYKYVRGSDGSEELYDLSADPAESTDVAEERPDVAADLRETLTSWRPERDRDAATESVDIAPETEQRLAELGYR